MGYGIVLVPAGIGCIINGRERGKGCSADTADRLSADLGTSTTDIFVQRSRTSVQRFQFYVIKGRHIHHGTLKKNSRSLAGHFSASLCSLVTCNKTGGTTLAWETSIGVRDYDLSISSYTSFKTQTGRHERKK